MRKGLKWVAIAAGVIVILGIVGVAVFSINVGKQVAEGLLYQNEGLDTKQNSLDQLVQWNYDKDAFLQIYTEETVAFTASDGNQVPAVLIQPVSDLQQTNGLRQATKTAILVHGAGGDHVCMYPVAEIYLENGYQTLIIDQRACGDSANKLVSFGYFEALDVEAAVDYAKKELQSEQVVLHGQSMGGLTCVVYTATEHAKENVDVLVIDSCIDSMESMFRGVWSEMDGTESIPVDYVVGCGDWYLKTHYQFGFADVDAGNLLPEDQIKTLMIYATEDELIPQETADWMFQAIGTDEKEFISFPCGHIRSIIDYKEACEAGIMEFVQNK